MVNVAYEYQNQKSVNYFMWHRSRRNIDGILESWYRSCSNIAGTPMPQVFPTGDANFDKIEKYNPALFSKMFWLKIIIFY